MKKEEFSVGDFVYIKSYYVKNNFNKHEILYLNNNYALIKNKKNGELYKKVAIKDITKLKETVVNSEVILKGDLVKCIVDNSKIEEGIVIDVYDNFVLVLISTKKKKVSKNRVIVINN
tara:strand:- start:57 stop:410 length:354 start_codon:yes stop_codon:yes gene_type:complete